MKRRIFNSIANIVPFVYDIFGHSKSLRIIYYHRINEKIDNYYYNSGITPNVFINQIEFLRSKYNIISLSEAMIMVKNGDEFNNHLCITFDDGFRECISIINPILINYKIYATFFLTEKVIDNIEMTWRNKLLVIENSLNANEKKRLINIFNENYEIATITNKNLLLSSNQWLMCKKDEMADFLWKHSGIGELFDYLNRNKPYLSENEIYELLNHGHEIGCHSYSHPFCDKLNKEEIDFEIINSARRIGERFSINCIYFSYPFGIRVSRENEHYILDTSNLKTLLGIEDRLSNKNEPKYWERVNMEMNFSDSKYSFFVSPFAKRIFNQETKRQ